MHKIVLTGIVLLKLHFLVFAQGEIDLEVKSSVRHERVWHGMINSNGWGAGYSLANMQTVFKKTLWNFEIANIHDLKEYKQAPTNYEGRRFAYGKLNSVFYIRSQYGLQKQLYSKRDKGGIEVRYYVCGGINLALLKPIYYNYSDNKVRKFEVLHTQAIQSRAAFHKGISETKIIPGVNFTSAASFEFSKRDKVINAVEIGIIADVFPKNIELMANDYNKFWSLSFFISYKFGKIVNPRVKNTDELPISNN